MWLVDGLTNALRMVWEVWWALVLGFALSAIVQAWVPRRRLERALGGRGLREVGAGLRPRRRVIVVLLRRGRDREVALRAWGEPGLGDGVPVRLDESGLRARARSLGLRRLAVHGGRVRRRSRAGRPAVGRAAARRLARARGGATARRHDARRGHQHHTASAGDMPLRQRVRSLQAWSDVAHNFRGDWQMLWKEITAGFLIAGYVATLPSGFFRALFVTHAWAPLRIAENVLVGPIVAALAFVCSIGNVPLAAVLWAGGGSFAGVLAFLYGDLIVLPIGGVLSQGLRRPGRGAARRRHVRRDGGRRARGRRAVLALRARPAAPAVGRVGRRAAGHVELHVGARHRGRGGLRGAHRAHAAPRRQGSRCAA